MAGAGLHGHHVPGRQQPLPTRRDRARLGRAPTAAPLTGAAPRGDTCGRRTVVRWVVPETALTPAIRDEIARLGKADIMVGIPSFKNAATIGYVVRAAQAGLVQYFPDLRPGRRQRGRRLARRDAAASSSRPSRPTTSSRSCSSGRRNKLERVSLTYPEIDGVGGKGAALRTIFEIAAALEVQALVVVDSDLRSIVPEWIELLAGPILKGGFDFVAPLYARYKYDGTITNTVTYPLTRALYGQRIRQPIGGDFGVCGDLVRHYLDAGRLDRRRQQVRHRHLDDDVGDDRWLRGLPDPPRRQDPRPQGPGADLGPMFRQVVGTILRLAERARRPLARRSAAATTSRSTASSGSSTRRRSR